MIVLGRPVIAVERHDLRDDRLAEHLLALELADHVERGIALRIRMREHDRPVLRADVVALPVQRGRIVRREEDLEDLAIADARRIERHVDDFRVARVAFADVAIAGIARMAARVTRLHGRHAVDVEKHGLRAPEAARTEHCYFELWRVRDYSASCLIFHDFFSYRLFYCLDATCWIVLPFQQKPAKGTAMATPPKLPRGIRLTTYTNKDGSVVVKYRVEITRKGWNGKRNNLFNTFNEAKAFLLLSKDVKGQQFIYQTEERTKSIDEYEWKDGDYTFGYFAKKYLDKYVFNIIADTELKRRNQAMKKAFINKICDISIEDRTLTPTEKEEMGLEVDTIVYRHFRSFDIREIDHIDINNFITTRLNGDNKHRAIKPVSVSRELTYISNVFNKLIHFDKSLSFVRNPTKDYDKDLLRNIINVRKRVLTDKEEEKFIEVIQGYKSHKAKHRGQFANICMLSLLTSMRRSEVVFLTKQQIKDDFTYIHLPITKSGRSRDVYLDTKAKEFLRNLEPMGENGRYFTYTNYGFARVFETLMKKNNLDIHFHDLRRTKISRMMALGGDENTIMVAKLLGFQSARKFEFQHKINRGLGSQAQMLASFGHGSIDTNFKHYTHIIAEDIKKMERLKFLMEQKENDNITDDEQEELLTLLLQMTK